MDTSLELSDRNILKTRQAELENQQAATQRRERLACFAAGLALFALLVAGVRLRVVMFMPH